MDMWYSQARLFHGIASHPPNRGRRVGYQDRKPEGAVRLGQKEKKLQDESGNREQH